MDAPFAFRSARCVQHPEREAAALCRGCGQSFCRECVTEHDGAMFCLRCLAPAAAVPAHASTFATGAGRLLQAAAALALLTLLAALAVTAMGSLPAHRLASLTGLLHGG